MTSCTRLGVCSSRSITFIALPHLPRSLTAVSAGALLGLNLCILIATTDSHRYYFFDGRDFAPYTPPSSDRASRKPPDRGKVSVPWPIGSFLHPTTMRFSAHEVLSDPSAPRQGSGRIDRCPLIS